MSVTITEYNTAKNWFRSLHNDKHIFSYKPGLLIERSHIIPMFKHADEYAQKIVNLNSGSIDRNTQLDELLELCVKISQIEQIVRNCITDDRFDDESSSPEGFNQLFINKNKEDGKTKLKNICDLLKERSDQMSKKAQIFENQIYNERRASIRTNTMLPKRCLNIIFKYLN
jgi:hypothetical protein